MWYNDPKWFADNKSRCLTYVNFTEIIHFYNIMSSDNKMLYETRRYIFINNLLKIVNNTKRCVVDNGDKYITCRCKYFVIVLFSCCIMDRMPLIIYNNDMNWIKRIRRTGSWPSLTGCASHRSHVDVAHRKLM